MIELAAADLTACLIPLLAKFGGERVYEQLSEALDEPENSYVRLTVSGVGVDCSAG